ncbi:MAG TPA: AAA family ATPase [Vicinamibacterales bacterium]|nr:AAA family ATPase [Vicinamibacterales bacterium]
MALECVILVGLPGAGKTTFFRERFAATHRHISKDLFPRATARQPRQDRLVREALAAGESVVVDNTNASPAERAPSIRIAHEYGAAVVGYFVEASTREAVARNRRREGRARVPDVAVFACAKRLVPPTLAEGFDQIHHVRVQPDGGFAVS